MKVPLQNKNQTVPNPWLRTICGCRCNNDHWPTDGWLPTRYRVMNGEEELNHMKRTLPSHHLTYETKGLQPHLEYQFWVTASTKIGEGQSSKVATQILSSNKSKCKKAFRYKTYVYICLCIDSRVISKIFSGWCNIRDLILFGRKLLNHPIDYKYSKRID